jgi:hypothetical protein
LYRARIPLRANCNYYIPGDAIVMLIHRYKPDHPNEIKWPKIFTWRTNGDGINPFGGNAVPP